MASKGIVVLELEGSRLTCLGAERLGERVSVRTLHIASRPESVMGEDAAAVGRWIAGELKAAGLGRRNIFLALSRGDVALKPVTLPVGIEADGPDAAGIVRLQLSKALTTVTSGTVIDFVPSAPQGELQTVLAASLSGDRVAWWNAVAKAGRLQIVRMAPRCFGAATLFMDLSQRRDGAVLGLCIGAQSSEFVVVESGRLVFARSVDSLRSGEAGERLAVEAKRTWVSHNGTRGGAQSGVGVEAVAVLDDGQGGAESVAERCAASVGATARVVGLGTAVSWEAGDPSRVDCGAVGPLVGLMVEEAFGQPCINFVSPRKAPDLGARQRQMVLAASLGLLLLGGSGYIMADRSLGDLKARLQEARQTEAEKRRELDMLQVEQARLQHLEAWMKSSVDWTEHFTSVIAPMPDPALAVLDELAGSANASLSYNSAGKTFPKGTWQPKLQVDLSVAGRVEDRQVATDYREKLIDAALFSVENRGPDGPDRFSLSLRARDIPAKPPAKKPAPSAPPPGAKPSGGEG